MTRLEVLKEWQKQRKQLGGKATLSNDKVETKANARKPLTNKNINDKNKPGYMKATQASKQRQIQGTTKPLNKVPSLKSKQSARLQSQKDTTNQPPRRVKGQQNTAKQPVANLQDQQSVSPQDQQDTAYQLTSPQQDSTNQTATSLQQDSTNQPATSLQQDTTDQPATSLQRDTTDQPATSLQRDTTYQPATSLQQDTTDQPATSLQQDTANQLVMSCETDQTELQKNEAQVNMSPVVNMTVSVTEKTKPGTEDEHQDNVPFDKMGPCKRRLETVTDKLEGVDVQYFKNLVAENTEILESLATKWDTVNEELTSDLHEVQGEIRTTSCQARLIITERFNQFSGLIYQCEFNSGAKPVLVEDLQGFWDMIYFQVEDVFKKFNKLEEMRANHWKSPAKYQTAQPVNVTKKSLKKKTKPVSKKPSKFAAFRAQLMKNKKTDSGDCLTGSQPLVVQSKHDDELALQSGSAADTLTESVTAPNVSDTVQEERTFSFRSSTVLSTIDCSTRNLMSTPCEKLKNVSMRTLSAKKLCRSARTAHKTNTLAASPDLANYMPSTASLVFSNSPALFSPLSGASPHLPVAKNTDTHNKSSCRRVVCSPSPVSVRAMLNASLSGKKTPANSPARVFDNQQPPSSLHKSVLTRNMPDSSLLASPLHKLRKLNLNEPKVVNDLVDFSPLPSTCNSPDSSIITPRRSRRLAQKRISLL